MDILFFAATYMRGYMGCPGSRVAYPGGTFYRP